MEGTETLCPHATILNHRWLPGTRSRLLSGKPDEWMHLSPFYTRMYGEWLRYANSTSQYSLAFSLYRDDWGFQVNPLCRHDITSPFPPSGNEGYVRNRDVLKHWKKMFKAAPLKSMDAMLQQGNTLWSYGNVWEGNRVSRPAICSWFWTNSSSKWTCSNAFLVNKMLTQ